MQICDGCGHKNHAAAACAFVLLKHTELNSTPRKDGAFQNVERIRKSKAFTIYHTLWRLLMVYDILVFGRPDILKYQILDRVAIY